MIVDSLQTLVVIVPIAFLVRTWGYGLYRVPTGSMETTMLVGEMFFADKCTYSFSKPKRGDIITFNEPVFHYSDNKIINLWQCYVWGPENWTKRLIGIPGDRVEGKIEEGKPVVYVNGTKLHEPYVNKYPLIPVSLHKFEFRSYDPNASYQEQPFYKMNGLLVKQIQRRYEEAGYTGYRVAGTPLNEIKPYSPGITGSDIFDVTLGDDQYWAMGDNRLGSWDSRGWGVLHRSFIHGKIVFRIFSIDTTADWLIFDILKHPISFWKRFRWSRCLQTVS